MSFLRRAWLRARALGRLARTERSSPRQIGFAVALGAFCGCTPALGMHGGLAVAAATVLRLNRMWAFVGSRVSNVFVLPFIVLAEIQLAHRLRTGEFVALSTRDAVEQGGGLLLDWSLGCLLLGPPIAAVCGLSAAYAVAFRRTRGRDRRRSEGSPPSG